MKIAVGIQNGDDLKKLHKVGADEYYVGIVPPDWASRFGYIISPNRRESPTPNVSVWSDLELLVQSAHEDGCDVFLTANAHEYSLEQMHFLKGILNQSLKIGINGFIVADPALLLQLIEWGFDTRIAVSGDFGYSNSLSLDWIAELGCVERIIFDRQTSLHNMSKIIERHPNFKYEAFVLNERCFFTGAHCMACHGIGSSNFCSDVIDNHWTIMASDKLGYKEFQDVVKNIDEFRTRERIAYMVEFSQEQGKIPPMACGLCSVARLKEIGISYLKIVARGVSFDIKEKIVALVAKIRDEIPTPETIKGYYINTFKNTYKEMCDDGYNCYRID